MPGGTPAHDPLSQVVPGKADMGDDYDAIVVQMTQLVEHSDPAQQPPWDGSGLPETAAEMQELGYEPGDTVPAAPSPNGTGNRRNACCGMSSTCTHSPGHRPQRSAQLPETRRAQAQHL